MTDKLNFLVKKDLWLTTEQEPFKILGWTAIKPRTDNGRIRQNTALTLGGKYDE